MNKIIVTGHGKFASGLKYAMEQIIGQQVHINFIDFNENKSPEQLTREIKQYLPLQADKSAVLFLCDILGGTPFRICSLISNEYPEAEVITGTNLQMLIECAMECTELSFQEAVKFATESGKRGITTLSQQLNNSKNQSSNNDGI